MNEIDYLNYQRLSEQEIADNLKTIQINQNTNIFIQLFKLILNSNKLFTNYYIYNSEESDISLIYMLKSIIELCNYAIYDIELTKQKRTNESYYLPEKTNKFQLYDY